MLNFSYLACTQPYLDKFLTIFEENFRIFQENSYTAIPNFEFPLQKHSGRQLLRKFWDQKFYQKLRSLEPKLRVFVPKLRFSYPKLRVFENRSFVFFVLQRIFFRLTETSGVDSGIFCDRNLGISNPYEVSNEVTVERKPEKFSKFQAKINYCVSKFKKKSNLSMQI
jgi:hypothetical protein